MPLKTSSGKPNYIGRFGGLTVPGTSVGAIVSIGMAILCWLAIPIARPFILGTGGLGLIVGCYSGGNILNPTSKYLQSSAPASETARVESRITSSGFIF